jgi:hypothetical protein
MRVAVEILRSTREPRRQVQHEQILAMLLRPGTIELGLRHSEMAAAAGSLLLGLTFPGLSDQTPLMANGFPPASNSSP